MKALEIESDSRLFLDHARTKEFLASFTEFGIPEPSDTDAYADIVDLGPIVPMSKLFSLEPPSKENHTRGSGMARRFSERIRTGMPGYICRQRYSPTTCELFTTRKARDGGPIDVIMPPARSDAYVKPVDTWTPEQEHTLSLLVEQYGFNWQLIADSMNGHKNLLKGGYTTQNCYDRWLQLSQNKAEQPALIPVPHPVAQPTMISSTNGHLDLLLQAKNRKEAKQKSATPKENKKRQSKGISLQVAFYRASRRRDPVRKFGKLLLYRH